MPRHPGLDDEWDDEVDFEPEEDEEEFGATDDGAEATVACPYCRRQIHEESERCPYCENYISAEDAPPSSKPRWFAIGVLICLLIVLSWVCWGL